MKIPSSVINRLADTEDWNSNLKDRVTESTQAEEQKEKCIQKVSIAYMSSWTTPSGHLHYMVPRRTVKRAENLLEKIIALSFPNLGKEIDIQIQEQIVPNKVAQGGSHQDT